MTVKEFSEKIKELGMTKKEFAEICNIHETTVSRWGKFDDDEKEVPGWVPAVLQGISCKKELTEIKKLVQSLKEI